MYTLHRSMNGSWYGSVTSDDPTRAREMALELAKIIDELHGVALRPDRAKKLSPAGEACLAYCEANPRCTADEYQKAGHTLRTVKWLCEHGYLRDVNGSWIVSRDGGL